MLYSQDDQRRFFELFVSNENAYGVTVVGEMVNGKAEAKSHLEHKALDRAVINKHLGGTVSVGAAPLREGDCVRWAAIDIDNYTGNLQDVVEAIEDFNIPLVPCYSKSKKLHVYCFFSEDAPADKAIELLRAYAIMFRCDKKVEIFPKQARTSANNRFYSWINLPYFDAADQNNHRKAVAKGNRLLTLSEFLQRAEGHQLTLQDHEKFIQSLPYYGAPPCIFSGVIMRDVPPGTRNNWMFNVACYLRMEDEDADIVEPLIELNDTLHTPLPEREIKETVAKVASRSYFYQCSGMVGCQKEQCKKGEKGIGSNSSTKFNFGQLTKVLTDPIQWEWEINGRILRFHDTKEIMNQTEFRRQCMEKLNDIPYQVAGEKWTAIIRRALENVIEEQVEIYGNFGTGSSFLNALVDYFRGGRRITMDANLISMGRIVVNADNTWSFSAQNMLKFLHDNAGLSIRDSEVRARLVEMGAKQHHGDVWTMPISMIPEKNIPNARIDYHDTEDENGPGF